MKKSTIEKINDECSTVTILRKEYRDNKLFMEAPALTAFEDILDNDRWLSDDYVDEEDSLNEFIFKCSLKTSWRKTNKYYYRFINFGIIDAEIEAEKALKLKQKRRER